MPGWIGSAYQFFAGKDWGWYPFVPTLYSLFLSIWVVPLFDSLSGQRLASFLEGRGLRGMEPIITGIVEDRALQTAYLTSLPSLIVSIIATMQSQYTTVLLVAIGTLLVLTLRPAVRVFSVEPGTLSTEILRGKRFLARKLAKRRWTWARWYTLLLIIFNASMLVVIAIALPRRSP
jgi:hypothetical protein